MFSGVVLAAVLLFGGSSTAWAVTSEVIACDEESLESSVSLSMSSGKEQKAEAEAQLLSQIDALTGNTPARASSPLNATQVSLYGLDTWAQDKLTIPSSLPRNFQLKVNGKVADSYRVVSGNSVTVDQDGNIEPVYTKTYWNGSYGSSVSSGSPNERVTIEGRYRTSIVQAKVGSLTYSATINFIDYASYYADGVMSDYINSNITASMSDKQKVEKIAEFVAGYDYSAKASGTVSMIVSGGGDCWASTYTVIEMAKRIGLDAWARDGRKDVGAGAGHMNAMVKAGGKYYEVEAGLVGSAPREYTVGERSSLFSYREMADGIEIYQYDEKPGTYTKVNIPSQIDNRPVVSLDEGFMVMNKTIEEVVLPDTLISIGKSAFNSASSLRKIAIPASVSSIGDFAFTGCTSLQDFTCSSANKTFAIESGILLNKEKTKVLFVPASSSCSIPSTVKTIREYAFYCNTNLTSVVVPSSVTQIEEGAFGNCTKLISVSIQGSGLSLIGAHAFNSAYSLKSLYLPESVASIGDNAFYNCSKSLILAGPSGSYAEKYAKENGLDAASVADRNPAPSTPPTESTTAPGGVKPGSTSSGSTNSSTPQSPSSKPTTPQLPVTQGPASPSSLKKGTSFTAGSLKYKVTKAGVSGKAEVQVIGSSKSKKKLSGTVKIPATVTYGKVSYKVTSLKAKAFKGYTKIKKVSLGNNLKTIGASAFQGCTKLTTVTVGKSVTTIGSGAFKSCKSLKKVTISSSKVKKIGSAAFKGVAKKAAVKAPAKKVKSYTKLLKKAGPPTTAKVKK